MNFKNTINFPKNIYDFKGRSLYFGVDPTAPFLHVGHYVVINLAINMQKEYGMKIIVLIGDATCRVGDPSDKEEQREAKSNDFYDLSSSKIKEKISETFDANNVSFSFVYNSKFMSSLNAFDFLSLCTRFSFNRIIKTKFVESFLSRQKNLPLSSALYFCMQAYDFLCLARECDCVLQIGGSDQEYNMISGVELGSSFGFNLSAATANLLTIKGKKIAKSDSSYSNFGIIEDEATAIKTKSFYSLYSLIHSIREEDIKIWCDSFSVTLPDDYNDKYIKNTICAKVFKLAYKNISIKDVENIKKMNDDFVYVTDINSNSLKHALVECGMFSSAQSAVRAIDSKGVRVFYDKKEVSLRATDKLIKGKVYYLFFGDFVNVVRSNN